MICFVITWRQKTLRKLRDISGMPSHRIWSYDQLFRAKRLPTATWVFTDFDRLSSWELELAAHVFRALQQQGMRVLNDPALAVHRFPLLRRLHAAGLNRFGVWRLDELDAVDRWPVFLRTEAAHRGPLTELIFNLSDLQREVSRAITQGLPVCNLMIVEYCAQPLRPDFFCKLAAFRIGDRLVRTLSVHDSSWAAKYGKSDITEEAFYQEELDDMKGDLEDSVLHQAFEQAHLEYGRVDYTIVDGATQVYEINSNPTIGRLLEHSSPLRLKAAQISERLMVEAFQQIDAKAGKPVLVTDELLARQRKADWFMLRSRWVI